MTRFLRISRGAESSDPVHWFTQAQLVLGWAIVLVVLSLVGAVYLNQASQIALVGRSTQLLQADLERIRQDNSEIEQQIAEAQSLDDVYARADRLGLQFVRPRPDEVDYIGIYIEPPAPPVADVPRYVDRAPSSIGEALWLAFTQSIQQFIEGESSGE